MDEILTIIVCNVYNEHYSSIVIEDSFMFETLLLQVQFYIAMYYIDTNNNA